MPPLNTSDHDADPTWQLTWPLLLSAMAFASSACVVLIGAELWWNHAYPESSARGLTWLFHGATFVLATLGSLLGFNQIDACDRTLPRAVVTGLAFGLISTVGAVAVYLMTDAWGVAVWLVGGSAMAAGAASLFSNRERPPSPVPRRRARGREDAES